MEAAEAVARTIELPRLGTRPGAAVGDLTGRSAAGVTLHATVATRGRPRPYRRPLAYYRLAEALGLRMVARTSLYRPNLATLRDKVVGPAGTETALRQWQVANDGSVAVLVVEVPAGEQVVAAEDGTVARAASLVASTRPVPRGETALARDYAALAVLDYLSANVMRRELVVDRAKQRIFAVDNASSFPGYVSPEALQVALDRLAPVVRFPKDLKERLTRLDQATTRQLDNAPRQEARLLGPRQIADLLDRRATVLTLVQARLLQYGPGIALSL